MADVSIKYKGVEKATLDASGTKTIKTSGKYCEADIVVDYVDPQKEEQSKTVTPTAAGFTVTPDSGKVLSSVVVNGDADLIAGNIKKDVDIFGVTGTLESGITPSGSLSVTANGTYDVTNYASAVVLVENPRLRVWDLTLSADVTSKTTVILSNTDAGGYLLSIRNNANAFVVLLPHSENLRVGSATNYIGKVVGTNRNTTYSGGASFRQLSSLAASSYLAEFAVTYGLNQQFGSGASSATAGHIYIDESGNMTMQLSTTYVLGAGEYTIIAGY